MSEIGASCLSSFILSTARFCFGPKFLTIPVEYSLGSIAMAGSNLFYDFLGNCTRKLDFLPIGMKDGGLKLSSYLSLLLLAKRRMGN